MEEMAPSASSGGGGGRKRRLPDMADDVALMPHGPPSAKRHELAFPAPNGFVAWGQPPQQQLNGAGGGDAAAAFAPLMHPPPLQRQSSASTGMANPLVALPPAAALLQPQPQPQPQPQLQQPQPPEPPNSLVLYQSPNLSALLEALSPALRRDPDSSAGRMVLDGGMVSRIARRMSPEDRARLAPAWQFVVS